MVADSVSDANAKKAPSDRSSTSTSSLDGGAEPSYGDFRLVNGQFVKSHGYNWLIAAMFVVGEMVGGGIIAMPGAINRATVPVGIPLLVVMAFFATISAIYLGRAWVIMLRMYPGYRTHCRKPYAEMGYRSCGPVIKIFVSISLNLTQIGASTFMLLVISRSTSNLLLYATNLPPISFCYVISIVAVAISPLLMCKSPSHFWQVIVVSVIATAVAVFLISLGSYWDAKCAQFAELPPARFQGVFLSLGVILFTVGGHSVFPTIQHDMRCPSDFTKSAIFAFIILIATNLVIVYWGAYTYGTALTESITESIQTPFIQQAVNILIGMHCLMTLTLLMNPFYQEMEEHLNIPHEFGWRRVVMRLFFLAMLVFLALTIPKFESVLGFVGGCLLTLTSLVMPPIFYLFLAASERRAAERQNANNTLADSEKPKFALDNIQVDSTHRFDNFDDYEHVSTREMIRLTSKPTLIICLTVVCVGLVFGTGATIAAVKDMAEMKVVPCYVAFFHARVMKSYMPPKTVTRCCGPYQNISLYHHRTCPPADFQFYNKTVL